MVQSIPYGTMMQLMCLEIVAAASISREKTSALLNIGPFVKLLFVATASEKLVSLIRNKGPCSTKKKLTCDN